MASLIASGATTDTSADFTVTAGVPVTISLHNATGVLGGDVQAVLDMKSSAGVYRPVAGGDLTANKPGLVIGGPGTFRVRKFASAVAFGVDKD